jgi:starch synthase
MDSQPLKICVASSELTPLAKTGGLADVIAALSIFLDEDGHEVRAILPYYSAIGAEEYDIEPVEGLQDLTIYLGSQAVKYSIESVALPGSQLKVYLLKCGQFFDRYGLYTSDPDEHLRFILLSRVAIEMCQHMGFSPDIFHCHDWHAALVPLYLKSIYAWDRLFKKTRSVLTIHNIEYQGVFGSDIVNDLGMGDAVHMLYQDDLAEGRVNFLKLGLVYADLLTTVSPTYAKEVLEPEYGMGLQDVLKNRGDALLGILNGVDYDEWSPGSDPLIPHPYDAGRIANKYKNKQSLMTELELDCSDDMPLVGMVSRLVAQKGIELVEQVMPEMLQNRRFALVVLGSGESHFEQFFTWLQQRFPGRVSFYSEFNNRLAHLIEAGSDMFLMPSRFEPCGLNQMYSLRYGTVPIVRKTGGLADSVQLFDPLTGEGTGIVFDDYMASALGWGLNFALDLYQDKKKWRTLMRNGMAMDYSWQSQGRLYVDAFRRLLTP